MIINPRILLLQLCSRINVANYFKYQRRPLCRLATVMFRGTPIFDNFAFDVGGLGQNLGIEN